MHIDGINHITLRVCDLYLSEQFYTQVLGLKRVGQRPHMRFYSSGRFAHELALMEDPGYQRNGNDVLMHLCLNVPDDESLRALYQHCRRLGLATSGGVDHRVMHSFYLRDPDGHTIEIGMDRPAHEWANHPLPFAEDYALDLKSGTHTESPESIEK